MLLRGDGILSCISLPSVEAACVLLKARVSPVGLRTGIERNPRSLLRDGNSDDTGQSCLFEEGMRALGERSLFVCRRGRISVASSGCSSNLDGCEGFAVRACLDDSPKATSPADAPLLCVASASGAVEAGALGNRSLLAGSCLPGKFMDVSAVERSNLLEPLLPIVGSLLLRFGVLAAVCSFRPPCASDEVRSGLGGDSAQLIAGRIAFLPCSARGFITLCCRLCSATLTGNCRGLRCCCCSKGGLDRPFL